MASYDAIVIGTGGIGSAALFHLARRGARVLGIDRFPAAHDRGSSHGHTRIIRQAYFEHSDYVPLLRRSYELWGELEQRCGQRLFHQVGLLEVGPPDGVVVAGVLHAARTHQLEVQQLEPHDVRERFAGFRVPRGCTAVFEPHAGYLLVEQCVLAHVEQARKLGAELITGETVQAWNVEDGQVVVRCQSATYTGGRLVIAAGAWSRDLLAELGIPFTVLRKHLHWFANDDPLYLADKGCPTFFYEVPEGYYYGFPQTDTRGVKAAKHSGGEQVADPLTLSRDVDTVDREDAGRFMSDHLPGVAPRVTDHAVCMYTMTPDEHFVVDLHPQHPQVAFAAGLSGHGFKFAGVLGEALADLTLDGATRLPVGFLSCRRPGLS